jgi:hypothetical protein
MPARGPCAGHADHTVPEFFDERLEIEGDQRFVL